MSLKSVHFKIIYMLIIIFTGVFYSIIWNNAPLVVEDTSDYVQLATDLQDGKLDELSDRAPGYSILLLATNSLEPSSRLFLTQLFLYLLSVFLLAAFLDSTKISKPFIFLFLLLSLIPSSVVNTVYMLTETFTTFLIATGAVSLFWWLQNGKKTAIIVSSVAFAFSAIVRPTYQLLFVMLIGILLILALFTHERPKKIFPAIASILLSFCLLLGGISWYNLQHFNYFGLTPMLGLNLSTKTVRVIERLPDEYKDIREVLITHRNSALIERNGSHTGDMYIWGTIPDLQRITGINEKLELSNFMLKLNLMLIRKAPLQYVIEVTRSLSTYWLPSSTNISNFNSPIFELLWTIVHFSVTTLFFLVTILIFGLLITIWRVPIEIKKSIVNLLDPFSPLLIPFIISLSIIFYTMIISTMIEVGNPRYRTPTDLLMFFALSIGLYFFTHFGTQASPPV